MLLSQLENGARAKVLKIYLSEKIKARLSNIGLTCGVVVEMVRRAPFGDPVEIKLRDFYLAIRALQAQKIEVEKI